MSLLREFLTESRAATWVRDTFNIWRKFQQLHSRTKAAETEYRAAAQRLAYSESELKLAKAALAVQHRDPLAEAQKLLAMADDLLTHSPVTMGEVRAWRVEYKFYRVQNYRGRQ